MKNIRNLLFDLDGTLVDSSGTISVCIDYALGRLGIPAAGELPVTSVIGLPLLDIFREHYAMTDDQADAAVAHYREHYDRLDQAGSEVYDCIPEVLSSLRDAGFRLYVATVKPTGVAEKVLADLGLRPFFNGVAGASVGHERRDKASIIAHALSLFELEPAQSLMIGDRDQDVIGARQNGLSCIAVSYGFGSGTELDSARPVHVAGHSTEIFAFLVNPFTAK